MSVEPIHVAGPLVAFLAAVLFLFLGRRHYGHEADAWELVRRAILPQLNRLARRNGLGYAAYTLDEAEFLGRIEAAPEQVERMLDDLGATRMPLAAFKYDPEGRPEAGSWAWRESLLAERQVHVHPFAVEVGENDGSVRVVTDLYGHDEFNAYNPLVAAGHYLGDGYIRLGEAGVTAADLLAEGFAHVRAQAAQYREGNG